MHIAALVDLGVPENWLHEQLARLPVTAEYQLTLAPSSKMGISGTQAKVRTEDQHDHRHHSTIVKMIKNANFPAGVEKRALDIFQAIADAEGKIHGVPPEKVHFHEVGATDSIVDIVAAALCIEYLAPQYIICNPVEVGGGHVDCAHGRFPVPAPATQELLALAPCTYGGVDSESTTPTGAAILSASVDEFQPRGTFTPHKIGYGIGHKDFKLPNVLRVALGEYESLEVGAEANSPTPTEQHVKIEANIDDMSPEAYEPLMQSLFDAGAVDVYLQPIIMKKNRPANCLIALCDLAAKQSVCNALLNSSTTIGLRIVPFEKQVLPRSLLNIATSYGEIRVKQVIQPDGRKRWKSEHDDIVQVSQTQDLDYSTTKRLVDQEISKQLD